MSLKSVTEATVGQLLREPLFRRLATGPMPVSSRSLYESDVTTAVRLAGSEGWQALKQEALNQYRVRLSESSKSRFNQWNDVLGEVNRCLGARFDSALAAGVECHPVLQPILPTVRLDFVLLSMEAEYSDVYQPSFYSGLAYWYMNGYLPCSWDGDFPSGRIRYC